MFGTNVSTTQPQPQQNIQQPVKTNNPVNPANTGNQGPGISPIGKDNRAGMTSPIAKDTTFSDFWGNTNPNKNVNGNANINNNSVSPIKINQPIQPIIPPTNNKSPINQVPAPIQPTTQPKPT
jgi:hypothetical protein